MKVIVSGCAGFIGSHTSRKLLQDPNNIVIGIDNMNDYYDVKQKEENLKNLQKYDNFIFRSVKYKFYFQLHKEGEY